MQLSGLLPVAYLLGSIPVGLLVGLAKGVDVRKSGSGNIGATNVARVLGGGRYFALVFTLDLLKGLLPTLAASWIVSRDAQPTHTGIYLLWLAVGFAAILGHMFSVFLKFTGGKGVATSAGVILGVWPYYTSVAIFAVLAFGISFLITRIVSLSSMVAVIAFPVSLAIVGAIFKWDLLGPRWPLLAFAILVAILVIWKHRSNISRLIAGTESSFRKKKDV